MSVFNGRMSTIHLSLDEFCAIAEQVCNQIPTQFKSYMTNVVVDVRLRPTRKQLASVGLGPEDDSPLGLSTRVLKRRVSKAPLYVTPPHLATP